MQYKVSELQGALLDAAVAKAEGVELVRGELSGFAKWDQDRGVHRGWNPSTDWRDGGPIIERAQISIETGYLARGVEWTAMIGDSFSGNWPSDKPQFTGPTPLIAAMRAYVASKFGETVDLP